MVADYNSRLLEAISSLSSLSAEAGKKIEESVRSTAKIVIWNRFNAITTSARKLGDPEFFKIIGAFVGILSKQSTGKVDAWNNNVEYFERYEKGPERLRDIAMGYVDLLEYSDVFLFQEDCVRRGQRALAGWGDHLLNAGKLSKKVAQPIAIFNSDGTLNWVPPKKYGKIHVIFPSSNREKISDKKEKKNE
jgi:hypothetical protein